MSSYDHEQLSRLIGMLPPAPEAWVQAAQELPAARRGLDQLVAPGQPCASDNRLQEATSLTYTTAPLKRPLHLSGPLSLTINGSTTALRRSSRVWKWW